jgi:hypothetical protein
MRTGISINVSSSGRRRLAALVRDRNAAQKHVWRAEIVLLSVDGVDRRAGLTLFRRPNVTPGGGRIPGHGDYLSGGLQHYITRNYLLNLRSSRPVDLDAVARSRGLATASKEGEAETPSQEELAT